MILELLKNVAGRNVVSGISSKLGIDSDSTGKAVTAALPLLMQAVANNARSGEGAESLLKAVSKKHDGSVLNDIPGFVEQADESEGKKILKHVIGENKLEGVAETISKVSGLDTQKSMSILSLLAPLILGAIGKKAGGLDTSGLSDLLSTEKKEIGESSPDLMNMFEKILDRDGDGRVSDDVLNMGSNLLKSLLK